MVNFGKKLAKALHRIVLLISYKILQTVLTIVCSGGRELKIWLLVVITQIYHDITQHLKVIFPACPYRVQSIHSLKFIAYVDKTLLHFVYLEVFVGSRVKKRRHVCEVINVERDVLQYIKFSPTLAILKLNDLIQSNNDLI